MRWETMMRDASSLTVGAVVDRLLEMGEADLAAQVANCSEVRQLIDGSQDWEPEEEAKIVAIVEEILDAR